MIKFMVKRRFPQIILSKINIKKRQHKDIALPNVFLRLTSIHQSVQNLQSDKSKAVFTGKLKCQIAGHYSKCRFWDSNTPGYTVEPEAAVERPQQVAAAVAELDDSNAGEAGPDDNDGVAVVELDDDGEVVVGRDRDDNRAAPLLNCKEQCSSRQQSLQQ